MAVSQGVATSRNSHGRVSGQFLRRSALLLIMGIIICSILIASLIVAAGFVSNILDVKTMVVTGGSMAPAIKVGDAVVMKPGAVGSIQVGDVITYSPYSEHRSVTHRVVAIKEIEGRTYFQTQGDSNLTPDPDLAPAESVYGKIVFTLPKFGYLLGFAATRLGVLLLFGLPLLFLLVQEIRGLVPAQNFPQLETHKNKESALRLESPWGYLWV